MTRTSKTEAAEQKATALVRLQELCKPGTTVKTILRHVSRSGMQREISCVVCYVNDDGEATTTDISWQVGQALGLRMGKRNGLTVGGGGMDMGFHLVNNMSYALHGHGGSYTRPCGVCGAVVDQKCMTVLDHDNNERRGKKYGHRYHTEYVDGRVVSHTKGEHDARCAGYTLFHEWV